MVAITILLLILILLNVSISTKIEYDDAVSTIDTLQTAKPCPNIDNCLKFEGNIKHLSKYGPIHPSLNRQKYSKWEGISHSIQQAFYSHFSSLFALKKVISWLLLSEFIIHYPSCMPIKMEFHIPFNRHFTVIFHHFFQ